MDIKWNLDFPEPAKDEVAEAHAKLAAEIARLGGTPSVEPTPTESQDSPPVTEAPPDDWLPPELVERVYAVQALHESVVTALAQKIITIFRNIGDAGNEDIRACAIGRALVVLADPQLVTVAYHIESNALPRKGDRVQEENGALGTVIHLQSLTEVIVKWDDVPKAMRSPIAHLTVIDPESEGE